MRKIIAALVLSLAPLAALAAGGTGVPLQQANIDPEDKASLQRGAQLFVNYCLSCHSAAYQRYNRTGRDIGLTDEQVKANLMFAADKIGELMEVAMRKEDASVWFGTAVPDLSLVARSRGVDWLYTYLLSFYADPSRPFGVNNIVFRDVGMPHVLWGLQGLQAAVYKEVEGHDGEKTEMFDKFELVQEGTMTEVEYKRAMRDLVNFLAYVGEPAKLERIRLGYWVLGFLLVFFVVSYLLKKEYWKDVH